MVCGCWYECSVWVLQCVVGMTFWMSEETHLQHHWSQGIFINHTLACWWDISLLYLLLVCCCCFFCWRESQEKSFKAKNKYSFKRISILAKRSGTNISYWQNVLLWQRTNPEKITRTAVRSTEKILFLSSSKTDPHSSKEVVHWQDFKKVIFPATKQTHFVPLSKHAAMAQAQAVSSEQRSQWKVVVNESVRACSCHAGGSHWMDCIVKCKKRGLLQKQ